MPLTFRGHLLSRCHGLRPPYQFFCRKKTPIAIIIIIIIIIQLPNPELVPSRASPPPPPKPRYETLGHGMNETRRARGTKLPSPRRRSHSDAPPNSRARPPSLPPSPSTRKLQIPRDHDIYTCLWHLALRSALADHLESLASAPHPTAAPAHLLANAPANLKPSNPFLPPHQTTGRYLTSSNQPVVVEINLPQLPASGCPHIPRSTASDDSELPCMFAQGARTRVPDEASTARGLRRYQLGCLASRGAACAVHSVYL